MPRLFPRVFCIALLAYFFIPLVNAEKVGFSSNSYALDSPPTISGTPATTATVGITYDFTPIGTDVVSFGISGNIPPGLVFDSETGALGGTPATAGTYDNIIITATNANGSASLPAFSIVVSPALTISGKVKNAAGEAIAGVTFSGALCTSTDSAGSYSCTVPSGWSGMITPAVDVYTFSPASRDYTDVISSQTDQDYVASFAESFGWTGWSTTLVSGTAGAWSMVSASAYPNIAAPRSGVEMAKFNSYSAESGNQTRLYLSNAISVSSNSVLKFWIYHDTGYPSLNDRLQVQVSTDGVVWTNVGGAISRYAGATGWSRVSLSLGSYAGQTIYLGFLGISEYGHNIYLDDVTIEAELFKNLTIASINPVSGTPITVSPADLNGTADGSTTLACSYIQGTAVTLTAPGTSGGNYYYGWTGCDNVNGLICIVFMSDDKTVTALYDTAPHAPTGVTSIAGNGQARISWAVAPGATSYNLYYSTTPDVSKATGIKITDVTSPYTVSPLTNGVPYYFVVTSLNAGTESGESEQVGVIPIESVGWTGWSTTQVSGTAGAWSMVSAGSYPSGVAPLSGAEMAKFNSFTAEIGSQARLYLNNGISVSGNRVLRFWMYHDTGSPSSNDRVQVQVSTDGIVWTDIGNAVSRYTGATGWSQSTVDLSAYIGQTIYIGFLGISEYGYDIHMDDVTIETPSKILTITSTNPAGATAITVSPSDLNGTANGSTPLARSYNQGATVTLIAPAISGGNYYYGWNGCDSVSGQTCTVSLSGDKTVTVLYDTAPHAYFLSDLAGEWDGNGSASGLGAPWWVRSTLSVAADGSFSGTQLESDLTSRSVSGVFNISSSGTVTIADNSKLECIMDAGKTVLACTDTWAGSTNPGTTELIMYTKKAATYSQADLVGDWEMNRLGTPGPHWLRGSFSIDQNGAFSGPVVDNNSSSATLTGTTIITNSGKITLAIPSISSTAECAMDASKTVFVCTETDSVNNSSILSVYLKKGVSYAQTDMTGSWNMNALASSPGAPWWLRSAFTIDSGGMASGTKTGSDDSSGEFSASFVVSQAGAITLSADSVAPCIMNSGKTVISCVGTWSDSSGTSELPIITKQAQPVVISVPDAPTGVSASAGDSQATVTFIAPASDGGSAITGYTVTSDPAGGVDQDAGSTQTTHTITNLTNGTPYTFSVVAANIVGSGQASSASNSVTPQPATRQLTVSLTGTGGGSVNSITPGVTFGCTPGSCQAQMFSYNTTITLSATPDTTLNFQRLVGGLHKYKR